MITFEWLASALTWSHGLVFFVGALVGMVAGFLIPRGPKWPKGDVVTQAMKKSGRVGVLYDAGFDSDGGDRRN